MSDRELPPTKMPRPGTRGRPKGEVRGAALGAPPIARTQVNERVLEQLGLDLTAFRALSEDEQAYVLQMIDEVIESGESVTATQLVNIDYKRVPVTMEQFLEDPYYLGKHTEKLFPACRALLIEMFDERPRPPIECIMGGSIGWGKTTTAALALAYLAYKMICLRDPHKFYGLMPGAKIVFAIYSVSIGQAQDTAFSKLLSWVDDSPFFVENAPRSKRFNAKIAFTGTPIQIITGSQEVHAIGKDLFAFVLDEANFLNAKNTAHEDQGRAYKIYDEAKDRLKSRFRAKDGSGDISGMIFLISSKRSKASFLENHVKASRKDIGDGITRLVEFARWEVEPASAWTKPKFKVEIGDRQYPSRILPDGIDGRPGAPIITVPGEFLGDFERNIDNAIRNHAGVATEALMPLIQDKSLLLGCIDKHLVHPFDREWISVDARDVDANIDHFFRPQRMFSIQESKYVPRYEPTSPRYAHIDIGLTGDCMGIAIVHISGFREVRRVRHDGTFYDDRAPVIVTDLMLQVRPPQGSEIDIAAARGFLISLRDLGLPIWRVSLDGFQSRETMQTLRKLEFDAIIYSVDKTDEAYMGLRQSINEQRFRYYNYKPFIREMLDLERDIDNGTVDHPMVSGQDGAKGSKDVSDAVAGATWQALIDPRMGLPGPSLSDPTHSIAGELRTDLGSMPWQELERELRT